MVPTVIRRSKGFTLVELLIVIAILAVLAAASAVVLNPGELLAQARDSQRIQDVAAMENALSLYISQATTVDLGAENAGGRCTFDPGAGNGPFSTATCGTVSTTRAVDGTGWIDVNFSGLPTGTPVPKLPLDPTNNANYFYAYKNNDTNQMFEVNARLESKKHRAKMTTDGGNKNTCVLFTENTCFYELGNDEGLDM